MLVACHLFVGALVGIALSRRLGDARTVMVMAMVGSILPDLIDKPLGHILLVQDVDNGRLVMHTAIAALTPLVLALVVRGRARLVLLALGLGILSHQMLDGVYADPVTWLWPLIGEFPSGHFPDYFRSGAIAELTTPTEWAFALSTVLLLLPMIGREASEHALRASGALIAFAWVLGIVLSPPSIDVASVTLAVVSLGGALVLMSDRWELRIGDRMR